MQIEPSLRLGRGRRSGPTDGYSGRDVLQGNTSHLVGLEMYCSLGWGGGSPSQLQVFLGPQSSIFFFQALGPHTWDLALEVQGPIPAIQAALEVRLLRTSAAALHTCWWVQQQPSQPDLVTAHAGSSVDVSNHRVSAKTCRARETELGY